MVDANFFFGVELFMTVLMENREAREAAAEKSGTSSSSERRKMNEEILDLYRYSSW